MQNIRNMKNIRNIKIAGGVRAVTNEFPFLVSIQYQARSSSVPYHICGGSIIHSRYILTAAHCMYDDSNRLLTPSTIVIIAGRNYNALSTSTLSGNFAKGSLITVHSNYNSNNFANDIAIITLDRDLTIDGITTRIAYLESGAVPIPTSSSFILVAGWGYTDSTETTSDYLMKVNVPIVSESICNASPLRLDMVRPRQICAGDGAGRDSCGGDSGGPLMRAVNTTTKDFAVVGIVSYGPEGCGNGFETNRGVYTNTTHYLNTFIRSVVSSVQTSSFSSNSSIVYVEPTAINSQKTISMSNILLAVEMKNFILIGLMSLVVFLYF